MARPLDNRPDFTSSLYVRRFFARPRWTSRRSPRDTAEPAITKSASSYGSRPQFSSLFSQILSELHNAVRGAHREQAIRQLDDQLRDRVTRLQQRYGWFEARVKLPKRATVSSDSNWSVDGSWPRIMGWSR